MHTAVGTTGPVSIAYDVIAGFRFYKKGGLLQVSKFVWLFSPVKYLIQLN